MIKNLEKINGCVIPVLFINPEIKISSKNNRYRKKILFRGNLKKVNNGRTNIMATIGRKGKPINAIVPPIKKRKTKTVQKDNDSIFILNFNSKILLVFA